MFIMGSGGHTTEMLSMIERSIRPAVGMYRRYVINEGDAMTRQRVMALEARLGRAFAAAGADLDLGLFDVVEVRRARRVHQSWLTTPLTALLSLVSVFRALLSAGLPFEGGARSLAVGRDAARFPGVVVTNGPGTGFLFAAAAHLLKVAGLAPEHRLRALYVESAAKVRTLSLTGRLLGWTGMADLFVVQHAGLLLAGGGGDGVVLGENFVVTPARPRVRPVVLPSDEEEGDDVVGEVRVGRG